MNRTRSRYQVTIEADPKLPIIRITRDFDATPAQLMRAHTDPTLFARWVGPNGSDIRILDWDATTAQPATQATQQFLKIRRSGTRGLPAPGILAITRFVPAHAQMLRVSSTPTQAVKFT